MSFVRPNLCDGLCLCDLDLRADFIVLLLNDLQFLLELLQHRCHVDSLLRRILLEAFVKLIDLILHILDVLV